MAENRKGSNTVRVVWDLAQPIVEGLGLILWDVKFIKEGANWYLRIIIDKEGGVCIDDCVAVNDALDAPLDEADPIEQSYNLQISSAGVERELTRAFHFERFMGQKIILKLRSAYEGVKLHHCVLKGYCEGAVTAIMPNGTEHTFEKPLVASVRLDDFDDNF